MMEHVSIEAPVMGDQAAVLRSVKSDWTL